jgi:hypothetical protein
LSGRRISVDRLPLASQRGPLSGARRNIDSLLHCIPLEEAPVLDCLGTIREIVERHGRHRQINGDPLELFDLLYYKES